eukprot:CAMPEP_0197842262 /NCGR_PEP_ID=MMETSP1437-20131217/46641_1 /TAXON_ID=49252 ORGANISM="Eucampia antarctica, Strain CCMP1452" /NCGR_SAMPLE_ID=MMETSP1437 /ASSEMBLY_ACC=CAM_ASM_001096 /LENGTH=675 /DNA_ID=CAMNT_0043452119 /DNA_START=40 /DNA_END=2067 /DNA_ORIENTATION=+
MCPKGFEIGSATDKSGSHHRKVSASSSSSLVVSPNNNSYDKIPRGGGGAMGTIHEEIKIFSSPVSKQKVLVLFLLSILVMGLAIFVLLYTTNHGFRRTVQFWKGAAPLALEYKLIQLKAKYMDGIDVGEIENCPPEYHQRIKQYHIRTAPKAVTLIIELGGIYVKIGQVVSTIGSGILDDSYITALQPLQDGVPARDYEQISSIIEKSTGRKMDDLFVHFEQIPIGSASIAQAHRATLRPLSVSNQDTQNNSYDEMGMEYYAGEEVVVKVQYPEVAEQFNADFNNLELLVRIFMPTAIDLIKSIRQRHEDELDFRKEAQNLREVTRNMQRHGLEPSIIRIPRVRNETGICTQHVLAMEYLHGISLNSAITDEQNKFAKALGKSDAEELRSMLNKRIREHFERGGGSSDENISIVGNDLKLKIAEVVGPFAASTFRFYAHTKDRVGNFLLGFRKIGATGPKNLSAGKMNSQLMEIDTTKQQKQVKKKHFNLAKIIKTLVHVHGIQLLKDGVYNADPHPGNCLILPDGRLGLLDYGMVGRFSEEQRKIVASVITALARKDKKETARWYIAQGYEVTVRHEKKLLSNDINVIHRFATFHFDKVDFSKITLETGEKVDVLKLLRTAQERFVPVWAVQGQRLGGLLMGIAVQTARPISLAKEWEQIASQTLKEMKSRTDS